jgi:predicted SAM-dependent methyltransferase
MDATQAKLAVMRSRPYQRFRDVVVRAHRTNQWVAREALARRHLRGTGIEIGALTAPLRVPPGVVVRHVDYKDQAALLLEDGPELAQRGLDPTRIPFIDVVDDAQTLGAIADASQDFVVSSHVLEHLEDPVGALQHAFRVLRPGGLVMLTLPDARHTFDAPRERTTVEHVLRDHREGPEVSRQAHYEEWARLIEGASAEADVRRLVEAYAAAGARHHFHVWDLDGFLQMFLALELPAEIVEARAVGIEFTLLARRRGGPPSDVA